MNPGVPRERGLLPALFLVALATVMFEVLLTRVFSLTMWYHFAFMAISIAMFGMTVGALLVFLRPDRWPEATLLRAMGQCALLFAISMAVVIFLHISLYLPSPGADMVPIVLTFIAVAVPNVKDRKSTRLNSSHSSISYAVFCLKKKINVDQTSAV